MTKPTKDKKATASSAFALRHQKRQKVASGFFAHVKIGDKRERAGVIKLSPGAAVDDIAKGQKPAQRRKWLAVEQAYQAGVCPADRETINNLRTYLGERYWVYVGQLDPAMVKPETKRLKRLARDLFGLTADEMRRQYWLLGAMICGKYRLTTIRLLIVQMLHVYPQIIIASDDPMPKPAMGRQAAIKRLAYPAK